MKKIYKKGSWIQITKSIPVINSPVVYLGIYYALPTGKIYYVDERHLRSLRNAEVHSSTGADLTFFNRKFVDPERAKMCLLNYKVNSHFDITEREKGVLDSVNLENYPIECEVKIQTESGTVNIQPEEYSIVSTEQLKKFFGDVKTGHVIVKDIGGSKSLKGKLAEQVFYLRQRGISYSEALQMCCTNLKSQKVLYLIMHPAYTQHVLRSWKTEIRATLNHFANNDIDFFSKYLSMAQQLQGFESVKN